jgi:8-amino-7-oxononanoate synthase
MNAWNFAARLEALKSEARLRARRTVASPQGAHLTIDGRELLSFAGNDYLGLAGDARLVAAAKDGAERYGAGSGASHLLSGHFESHAALEEKLAAFVGMERALTFSTGYLANLAILTALADRETDIFGDKLNHACLNDGARLSRAEFKRYNHLDLAQLERLLDESNAPRKIIATDSVFSMDGDLPPLGELLALAERHDALLVIDDAHGFGVLGPHGKGSLAQFGLASPRIVYMATLGKAAGVAGAFVAGRADIVEWILQTARSYLFTTAAPPLLAHAALAAVDLIHDEQWRRERLFESVARLKQTLKLTRWRLLPSGTAIQPVLIGENAMALAAADRLYAAGIWAPAIRPPTVPEGTARLRISISAAHSREDVERLVGALHDTERALA